MTVFLGAHYVRSEFSFVFNAPCKFFILGTIFVGIPKNPIPYKSNHLSEIGFIEPKILCVKWRSS